jgi:myosin-3
MLEATRIRREGYAVRPRFEDFVRQFKLLAYSASARVEAGPLSCQKILAAADVKGFLIG